MRASEKWSGRLWQQLKPLNVWVSVIATVLATLAVTLHIDQRAEEKPKEKNVHVVEKLKIEIEYRATRTKEYLENVARYMESGEIDKLVETVSELLVQVSDLAKSNPRASLFSEYANQNMGSLLSQLTLILKPDSNMQKILDTAIASTMELENMSADILSDMPKTTVTELIEGTKRQLKDLAKVTGKSYLANGENSE